MQDESENDDAEQLGRAEVDNYKAPPYAKKIISEITQQDGSVVNKIIKQDNARAVSNFPD